MTVTLTPLQRTILERVAAGKVRYGSAKPDIDRATAARARAEFRVFVPGDYLVFERRHDVIAVPALDAAALIEQNLIDLPDRDPTDPGWQAPVTITDEGRAALA